MGSPKTTTVGGGSATGTADAFQQWLSSGLGGNGFGTGANGSTTGVGQALGQTQGFGSAVNAQLGGGNTSGVASFYKPLDSAGNGGANYNGNITGSIFGGSPSTGTVAGTGSLLDYTKDSPEFAALQHIQDMRTQQGAADVRARFGAGGGSALGSGASFAESQFHQQNDPANTLALGELGRQMQQTDMANRGQNGQLTAQHIAQIIQSMGIDAGNNLQNQNQQNNFALGSAGIGNQMFGMQSSNINDMLGKLFGSFNQSSQIGLPQAQTVQTPSTFGQITSGIGDILGSVGKLASFRNPFGGDNNNAPQFGGPQMYGTQGGNPYYHPNPFGGA